MEIHYSEQVTHLRPTRSLLQRLLIIGLSFFATVLLLVVLVGFYVYELSLPPTDFPQNTYLTIEEGSGINEIVTQLKEANIVRSENLLYFALVFFNDPTTIMASTYRFNQPSSVFEVARRLTEGDFGIELKRFVHYEGERATDIAERADAILKDFDSERFITLAEPDEGKLFPDTYLVPETYTADELYQLMRENYEARVGPLRPAIEKSQFTENEVIVLASILEREANSRESKRIVSGILQNRLEIGMPLQADAVFEYILNKPGTQLTRADLSVDDPYNTYTNPGLPPGPIGNPGLEAIEAVLEPDPSSYLFYITDANGVFHYSYTLDQHNANVATYLR